MSGDGNLLADLPEHGEEDFQALLEDGALRIERIVSRGHASPAEGWYDQAWAEWVLVVTGAAIVEFADGRRCDLVAGDYLAIPAHARHRVRWTDPAQATVWLAVHHGDTGGDTGR